MAEKFARLENELLIEQLREENEQLKEQVKAYIDLQARIPNISRQVAEDVIQTLDEDELLEVHRGEADLDEVLRDD